MSVPASPAGALAQLLAHCSGAAHLRGVLAVNNFPTRWMFCEKRG